MPATECGEFYIPNRILGLRGGLRSQASSRVSTRTGNLFIIDFQFRYFLLDPLCRLDSTCGDFRPKGIAQLL